MDPTISTIIKYAAIIVVVLLIGWFLLEFADRVFDDDGDDVGYAPYAREVAG